MFKFGEFKDCARYQWFDGVNGRHGNKNGCVNAAHNVLQQVMEEHSEWGTGLNYMAILEDLVVWIKVDGRGEYLDFCKSCAGCFTARLKQAQEDFWAELDGDDYL